MTRLNLFYIICCSVYITETHAQHAYFPSKGIISFEKEVYLRARIREMANQTDGRNRGMMRRFGSNTDDVPDKKSTLFILRYDEHETLMLPAEEVEATSINTATSRSTGNRGGNRNSHLRNGSTNICQSTRLVEHKVYYQ